MGDDLGGGRGHDGGQAEGAHGPAEVGLPPGALQGQTLAQGWLVHLCSDATSACSDLPLELLASGSPAWGFKKACWELQDPPWWPISAYFAAATETACLW